LSLGPTPARGAACRGRRDGRGTAPRNHLHLAAAGHLGEQGAVVAGGQVAEVKDPVAVAPGLLPADAERDEARAPAVGEAQPPRQRHVVFPVGLHQPRGVQRLLGAGGSFGRRVGVVQAAQGDDRGLHLIRPARRRRLDRMLHAPEAALPKVQGVRARRQVHQAEKPALVGFGLLRPPRHAHRGAFDRRLAVAVQHDPGGAHAGGRAGHRGAGHAGRGRRSRSQERLADDAGPLGIERIERRGHYQAEGGAELPPQGLPKGRRIEVGEMIRLGYLQEQRVRSLPFQRPGQVFDRRGQAAQEHAEHVGQQAVLRRRIIARVDRHQVGHVQAHRPATLARQPLLRLAQEVVGLVAQLDVLA
jgi:hypothetical protein